MCPQIQKCSLSKGAIYTTLCLESENGAYVSYLRGKRCQTENDFFREVSASFQFPWYFGENWAAFDECICDLEWLKFESIFLVIDDFSMIFDGNVDLQALLIKYLTVMVEHWQSEKIPIRIYLNN